MVGGLIQMSSSISWKSGSRIMCVGSDRIDCSMTEKEYEQQYSEALAELRSRGSTVASPYTPPGGIREVRIDSFRRTDRLVFEKAWGQEIAEKIMSKKPSPH